MLPEKRFLRFPVRVRPILTPCEMKDYYELRYDVYHILGYLDEQLEGDPSHMEIDPWDTRSLHLGAFSVEDGEEKLIGTVRLTFARPEGMGHLMLDQQSLTQNLVKQDPIHAQRAQELGPMSSLPIIGFQVDQRQRFVSEEERCGELGRVVVASEYRGMGIRTLLVKEAIRVASETELTRLFVEGLETHEQFYRRFGFAGLEAEQNRVVGVRSDRVAMVLSPIERDDSRSEVAAPDQNGT